MDVFYKKSWEWEDIIKNIRMKTSNSQANILSNLSFVLVDIIESCFIEANEKLKSENCEFKHEAKREFNLLLSHCRNLKDMSGIAGRNAGVFR